MRRLVLLFFLFQIIQSSCPDGFELVAAGECRQSSKTVFSGNVRDDQATDTAISKCNALQAQPVIIHDDEQQSVEEVRQPAIFSSSLWTWVDGSALDYKPAPSSGYNGDLDKNCKSGCAWFIGNKQGYWYESCDSDLFYCDIRCTTQLPPLPVPNPHGCESFEDDNDDGVCYQVGAAAASWSDAQRVCQDLGANLASIHNAQENSFVRRLAVSRGVVNGIFLGSTSSGKGSNYGWIDGSEWDYQNFYAGFPVKGLGDCVSMDTQSISGEWVNTDCSSNFSVACIREQKEPACSAQTWKEGQLIVSPGFPYNASIPCDFMLMVDAGRTVEVEIVMLEANSCCDNLIIFENSIGKNVIANLTGEISHKKYTTSSSNFMRVSWQPNGGVNVRGLVFTFTAV